MYTTRLIVTPNYGNRFRTNSSSSSSVSSSSYPNGRFRTTLIIIPNTNRKRFIQSIEIQCGNFNNSQTYLTKSSSPNRTTSDVFSADESICEYYPLAPIPLTSDPYFDVRYRLLAKSNRFASTLRDETDYDDNDSFYNSSIGYYPRKPKY